MFILSNGHMSQAEIIQSDRWQHGPLELVFVDFFKLTTEERHQITQWNMHFRAGCLRPEECVETVEKIAPWVLKSDNPNIFFVLQRNSYTELHAMLASLVPETILKKFSISKRRANFHLIPYKADNECKFYADQAVEAFGRYVWTKISLRNRCKYNFFDKNSPLRILASDYKFWMSRVFRYANECTDHFEETTYIDPKWKPLEVLREQFLASIPVEIHGEYKFSRPISGGDLWQYDDQKDCDEVLSKVISNDVTNQSLDPILEVLNSHHVHEDFSDRFSWIKEDFERSFYSKRSKVKISLMETVDGLPVWDNDYDTGYANLLFRDILSFFDQKDHHIILAIRSGKTTSEVASEMGLKGHASISRKLKKIKSSIKRLLKS